mgnify:CR=1 FL=1
MNGTRHQPAIAIIDANTLSAIGLKQLLQQVMPFMQITCLPSVAALRREDIGKFFHYFASMDIVLAEMPFFLEHRRKTIVLSHSTKSDSRMDHFHHLFIDQPEQELIRSLLVLVQMAHGHGEHLPLQKKGQSAKVLTQREIEVLSLIVRGFINKEIADRLHISLTTVISHRKNITGKLGLRSIGALTIYAVMQGYVDISEI